MIHYVYYDIMCHQKSSVKWSKSSWNSLLLGNLAAKPLCDFEVATLPPLTSLQIVRLANVHVLDMTLASHKVEEQSLPWKCDGLLNGNQARGGGIMNGWVERLANFRQTANGHILSCTDLPTILQMDSQIHLKRNTPKISLTVCHNSTYRWIAGLFGTILDTQRSERSSFSLLKDSEKCSNVVSPCNCCRIAACCIWVLW